MSLANDMPSEDRAGTGQFNTTHWSVVLAAGASAIPGARGVGESIAAGSNSD